MPCPTAVLTITIHTRPHMTSKRLQFSSVLALGILLLATLAFDSTEAHMAMLYPPPRGGYGTKGFDWRIHEFIGYKGFKYPCGGYKKGPNTSKLVSPSYIFLSGYHWAQLLNSSTDALHSFAVLLISFDIAKKKQT